MKTIHTSPPWGISRHSKCLFKIEARNRVICDGFGQTTEDDANARLIAAAPDLLGALEAFLSAQGSGGDSYTLDEVEHLARQAIARAKEVQS
jgi:hypothetical protein